MTNPSEAAPVAWETLVSANYRVFHAHDPTGDDASSFHAGPFSGVDWSPYGVTVEAVSDLVSFAVVVRVVPGPPEGAAAADLLREGEVEFPGGQIALPESHDREFQIGRRLPAGPGTYGVRVAGHGRERVRLIRETAPDHVDLETIAQRQSGVERYVISLWQVSTEPARPDDDDDQGLF